MLIDLRALSSVVQAIHAWREDCYFLDVTGVNADFGLPTGDAEQAQGKVSLTAIAAETLLAASSDKLDKVSPFRAGPLSALTTLLVSPQADTAQLEMLQAPGLEVVTVSGN